MKVVINACFGGFGLSHEGVLRYLELAGRRVWPERNTKFGGLIPWTYWLVPPEERQPNVEGDRWHEMPIEAQRSYNKRRSIETFDDDHIERNDPLLVRVVEELGTKANGSYASLRVVDVPDDAKWEIDGYDGNEYVAETHRSWR